MQFLRFLIVDRGETFGQLSHALDHVELGWIDLQITHVHALRAGRIGRFGLEVTGIVVPRAHAPARIFMTEVKSVPPGERVGITGLFDMPAN